MNAVSQVRKQVVKDGKMKFGAQSRLSQILGMPSDVVKLVFVGNSHGQYRSLPKDKAQLLEKALEEKVPLFSIPANQIRCSERGCGKPSYAKEKCKYHYYNAWKESLA